MARLVILAVATVFATTGAIAQASKQLEQRAKDSQAAQEKSWKQVDQINREADQTTARLHESRKSSTESVQNARSPVKRTVIGTQSPYAKQKRLMKPNSTARSDPKHR